MANDLVRTDDGDGFNVTEPRTGFITGAMLKFVDRNYVADKTEVLPEGMTLIALSVITAWVKWAEGKPVEHRVTRAGQGHPRREDLPDQDESLWEAGKFSGAPTDCWHDSRYLHLIDPRAGRDLTFTTSTWGGRAAVGELKDQISNVRRARPGVVPLVRLAWKMMSTNFGPRPRPLFEVVEWRDGGSNEPVPQEPTPQIKGPDSKKVAIEHRVDEFAKGGGSFDDSIPFAPEWR